MNFIHGMIKFLREVRAELRKVLWPTRRETVIMTSVVIASVLLVALLIWGVDSTLSFFLKLILRT